MELHKRRLIGPGLDLLGPDLGSSSLEMDFVNDTYAMIGGHGDINASACVSGKSPILGGIEQREAATGLGLSHGVRYFLNNERYIETIGLQGRTFIVQGFGNVGSHSAIYLCQAGMKLIGVIEEGGSISNPRGINANVLANYMKKNKTMNGFLGAEQTQENLLEAECYLLVLAYAENVITIENAANIKAKVIAEGADNPTTPGAERILLERRILIIPDVFISGGGVFVSYLEWVKNTQHVNFGFLEGRTEQEVVEDNLRRAMDRAADNLVSKAERYRLGLNLRTAAYIVSLERIFDTHIAAGYTI